MRGLFNGLNPLQLRLSESFFRELPEEPGVYRMLDSDGHLLYVGKAKNLKARLTSYRSGELSTKVRRLISKVARIEFELCGSEKEALLRENQLIRLYRPAFNRQKANPEAYFLLSLLRRGSFLELRPYRSAEDVVDRDSIVGVYKSQRNLAVNLQSLYRILSAMDPQSPNHNGSEFRSVLMKDRPNLPFLMEFSSPQVAESMEKILKRFMRGISKRPILRGLEEGVLALKGMAAWIVRQDQAIIEEFFQTNLRRQFRMRNCLPRGVALQPHLLDDLIVEDQFRSLVG